MATEPDPAGSAPSEAAQAEKPADAAQSPEEAFASLRRRFDEFVDYAVYYVLSRLDAIKFAVKRRLLTASLVAIGVLAAAGAIITAVALLCEGISDGLADLLGHKWAGEILAGVLFLGIVAVAGIVAVNRLVSGPHSTTVRRYDELRRRQRERYGHDVRERAREDGRARGDGRHG